MRSKSNNFKKLQEEWYKKLETSGFKDIEQDEYRLKSWSNKFSQPSQTSYQQEAKFTYYNMAESFLHTHKFATSLEYAIWEYHANGISVRNISKLLAAVDIKAKRTTVWSVVKKLRDLMFKQHGLQPEDEYDV